ncbi:MAG: DNA gyrase subunit A [Clostridia bacterium]|nr:DNA gyrase subunit A [Clostridia bacterium]
MDNQDNINIKDTRIIDVDIEKEMKKSFLDYSMSVIVSRALPDVRDGLKPVHRRILYALFEDNLGPDKAYRKCANVVGSVLGRYHPHGDSSVYDALVRLAQDFSMRYILVDGHGNFGSVDGDPPAAYRYTESRMSKISVKMLTDIDKETVDFVSNYDDRLQEPTVLPSRFPNLLVNGSTGIAVGMATNIPPHNMNEVIDAMCYVIDNPECELHEICNYIKGPDFPTGGIIMGKSGIRAAYSTGRGKIILRAKTEIIEENNKSKIIVTELPYQVNKARLIESIADMVKDKKLDGISRIEDHSDRNGMHIEIDLKRDAVAQVVLNKLFSYSQLQITYGIIMLSIVNGEPKILNLKQILEEYIKFQIQVITRRVIFDLKKAKERAHILRGLKIALDYIDEVINILRSSGSIPEAKSRLSERFGLDDIQTQAIVQMPLGRLTGLERNKIEEELNNLDLKISEYNEILASEIKIKEIIKTEALEIKKSFGDERRTQIENISGEVDIEDLIPEEDCAVTLTHFGYVKRQSLDSYRLQRRGGRGISGMTRREEDTVKELFVINNHDYVLFFTNMGRVYRIKCYEIPEGSRTSKGTNIKNILPLGPDEQVTSVIKVPEFVEDKYLIMVTRFGVIKRVNLNSFDSSRKSGLIALDLDDGDELSWVRLTDGNQEVIIATKYGKSIRFIETDVRCMGRTARGVRAMKLKDQDEIVGMIILKENCDILTVSETGYGRLSDIEDYRLQSRSGQGVINYHVEKYGNVAAINLVEPDQDVIMISNNGVIIRIEAKSIRKCSRPSKGVTLMRLPEDSKVVAVACVPHEEEEITDNIPDTPENTENQESQE